MQDLKNKIINALRDVYDPEIPINVYDLGLIYEINIKESGFVHVLMSLTSPTCPTAEYIQEMIHDAVIEVDGVSSVDIELTFEPLWTPDRVSEEAKEELGISDDFNSEDLSLQNTFSSNDNNLKESKTEHVCFNCSVTDEQLPIFSCFYKGENTKICSKCISKFK